MVLRYPLLKNGLQNQVETSGLLGLATSLHRIVLAIECIWYSIYQPDVKLVAFMIDLVQICTKIVKIYI